MRGYLDLMKLRVVELLLVSTLPAMVLAAEGLPDFGLAIATIFAGTLAAGSANAFNMVIESDLDKLMARTAKRPIVTGQISKLHATIFASLIGALSLLLFWIFTTPLSNASSLDRNCFLCRCVHDGVKATHRSKHCVGWRCRLHAGINRMGSGNELFITNCLGIFLCDFLLDAPTFLGVSD